MDDIVKIASAEGEEIKIKRVKAIGVPVEKWLQNLQETMVFSVRRFIKEAQIMHKDDQEDFKRI